MFSTSICFATEREVSERFQDIIKLVLWHFDKSYIYSEQRCNSLINIKHNPRSYGSMASSKHMCPLK